MKCQIAGCSEEMLPDRLRCKLHSKESGTFAAPVVTPKLMRLFPILASAGGYGRQPAPPRTLPWEMIATHEPQALRNHGQTIERLAERGGLSHKEALAVIEGKDFYDLPETAAEAAAKLLVLVDRFNASLPNGSIRVSRSSFRQDTEHWLRIAQTGLVIEVEDQGVVRFVCCIPTPPEHNG